MNEIVARSLNPWPLTVVGIEGESFSLHHTELRKKSVQLSAQTLRGAVQEALLAGVGAVELEDLFETPPEIRPAVEGKIYFVAGDVGAIKIGFAANPELRLRDLQTGSPIPLKILAVTAGMPSLEREYHRRFAAHRLHGEWFSRTPELMHEIERLCSIGCLQPLSTSEVFA